MILIIPPSSEREMTFSLGVGYLASVIKSLGKNVKVLNCSGVKNWREIFKSWLTSRDSPLYVGITTDISNIGNACDVSRFAKSYSPSTKIILGGAYATSQYKELIPKHSVVYNILGMYI